MKKPSVFPMLQEFDRSFQDKAAVICGIDEAGRGPLAGPVVAACVVLKDDAFLPELNDSKKLTEKKREILYDVIIENCITYGIGSASPQEIDELNILQATYLAMTRASQNAGVREDWFALVDGNRIPPMLPCQAQWVVKGDAKSADIAAASVLAKVTRDRELMKFDEIYPQYGFAKHKGYPTKAHYEAIKQFGILPIHRMSFLKNLEEK